MSKKQVISCRSQDEMEKTADRMSRQGYIVKTVVRMTPFHLYGLCEREFKVEVRDETMAGKREEHPGFLKRILRRTIWRSDLRKTSALSENSAL